jgi:hypothetical protein
MSAPPAHSISGVLWKCKYGITGSVYWKKKFCYADEEKLLHWQTDKKPNENEKTPPRHGFLLHRCNITEEPKLRPCAFKLVDKIDNRSMTFAANNVAEYEKWLKVLMVEHKDPNTAVSVEDTEEADEVYDFDFDNDDISVVSEREAVSLASGTPRPRTAMSMMSLTGANIIAKKSVKDIAQAFFSRTDVQVSFGLVSFYDCG